LAENNITTSKELPTKNISQVVNKPDLKGFSIMHLNIASLIKHIDQLRINLIDKPCHILSVNESSLSDDINVGFVKIEVTKYSGPIETEQVVELLYILKQL
jgi:hypothetical protein